MNLYLYDHKHDNVLGQMDLTGLDVPTVAAVVQWLRSVGHFDRYCDAAVATGWGYTEADDYEEGFVYFEGRVDGDPG